MLNDLSLLQAGRRLCGEEWNFQQDNAAIYNASITKEYFLEQKIRVFDTQRALQKLVDSMLSRIFEVIKANGGSKKY